jgi:hypothetical protein
MARTAQTSIDSILQSAASKVVARVSAELARQMATLVQEGLERELQRTGRTGRGRVRPARSAARRRPPRTEITKWVADNRARRVPTFVIEATGLDTKKKIVARYGANVSFEKGKPLPKPKAA